MLDIWVMSKELTKTKVEEISFARTIFLRGYN